jgi:hypothetical protein
MLVAADNDDNAVGLNTHLIQFAGEKGRALSVPKIPGMYEICCSGNFSITRKSDIHAHRQLSTGENAQKT